MKKIGRITSQNGGNSAVSGAQATLILLAAVLLAAIVVKSAIGDAIVPYTAEFGNFRAWGGHNDFTDLQYSGPYVTISGPADGSSFFNGDAVNIHGNAGAPDGRAVTAVYYRINNGSWIQASLSDQTWYGTPEAHPPGSYLIEAMALDSSGMSSLPAFAGFMSIIRMFADALYLSDDIPSVMAAGEEYLFHVTYKNTGNIVWNSPDGFSLEPTGTNRLGLTGSAITGTETVSPSGEKVFNFTVPAPQAIGTYDVGLMMKSNVHGPFGEPVQKTVDVVMPIDNATIVSISHPQLYKGEAATITITVRNTGTTSWKEQAAYPVRLGMKGERSILIIFKIPDREQIDNGAIVRPGDTHQFLVNVTPGYSGWYYFEYQMIREGQNWFGKSNRFMVTVDERPTITPTPGPGATMDPYQAYTATGSMVLILHDGEYFNGCISYVYDGPICNHYSRASYYDKWDIGGPNGHYRIYKDGYIGEKQFDMNNGGNKGLVTFREP